MSKVLVLAVHPDDETLGCGGTLLKHKAGGDEIFWLIATSMKEDNGLSKEDISHRAAEIETIINRYNFDGVYNLGIPTTKVDEFSISELIKMISKVFDEVEPNILYLPFIGDIHSDHRIIVEAAHSCTKTFRYPFIKKVMMMETISETEFALSLKGFAFVPNHFVDISDFIDEKLDIMKTYKDEISCHPFPRSLENIKALSVFRGATAGCKYAESFMVPKEIW